MNNFGIPLKEKHSDCDGIRGRTRTRHTEGGGKGGKGGGGKGGGKKIDELQIKIDNCAQGRLKWGSRNKLGNNGREETCELKKKKHVERAQWVCGKYKC